MDEWERARRITKKLNTLGFPVLSKHTGTSFVVRMPKEADLILLEKELSAIEQAFANRKSED